MISSSSEGNSKINPYKGMRLCTENLNQAKPETLKDLNHAGLNPKAGLHQDPMLNPSTTSRSLVGLLSFSRR